MDIRDVTAKGIRFAVTRQGEEVGHAYLYVMHNDLHEEPFGLLEDVQVLPAHQGAGIGGELLAAVLERARAERCYKLLATSRNDGTRQSVHDWYLRLGFRDYGTEFRMDF